MELEISNAFLSYLSSTSGSVLFPIKKCIDKATKAKLMEYFKTNPRPNKNEINEIAKQVKLDKNKIFWFFVNARRKVRENEKRKRTECEKVHTQAIPLPMPNTCTINDSLNISEQMSLHPEYCPLTPEALALQQRLEEFPETDSSSSSSPTSGDDIFSESTFSDSWFSDTDYTSSDSFFEESSDCSSESSYKRDRSSFEDEGEGEYPFERLTLNPL